MSSSFWIKNFLDRRELEKFNGDALYSYHMTDEEYATLKQAIEHDLKTNAITSTSLSTVLVLYACEWWRREYEGSNWSWSPIFQSLNLSMTDIGVTDRNQIFNQDIKNLNRHVLKSKGGENEYLGTIVVESGIPRSILKDDHYLSKIIIDSFNELQMVSSFDLDEQQIISEVAEKNRLPKTFQKDFFYSLIADIVKCLIRLNDRFELKSIEKPVEYLNSQYPQWNNALPIVLDSDLSIRFLNKLLSDSSKQKIEIPPKCLSISNCLVMSVGDSYRIERKLKIKDGHLHCSILSLTIPQWEALPTISDVKLDKGDNAIGLGSLYKINSEGYFNIIGFGNVLLSSKINEGLSLYIYDPSTCEKLNIPIDAPNFLHSDTPLIFENKDEKWILKSIGSCKLRPSEYRILLPDTFKPDSNIKELEFNEGGLALYEIDASTTFSSSENKYAITFSELDDSANRYLIEHASSSNTIPFYPSTNSEIYLGNPRFYQLAPDGTISERYLDGLEYLSQLGDWSPFRKGVYGRLKVRRKDKLGHTLFCQEISVLPSNFRVELYPNQRKDGMSSIKLIGLNGFRKKIYSSDKSTIQENNIEFENLSNDENESFTLSLYSDHSANDVSVKLPLPKNITAFQDENRLGLNQQSKLSIRSLLGKRFVTNNLSPREESDMIEMNLIDPNIREKISISQTFRIKPYGTFELPLIQLREKMQVLFSISTNNDTKVRVKYKNHWIHFRQFDSKPFFKEDEFHVSEPYEKVQAFRLDRVFSTDELKTIEVNNEGKVLISDEENGLWFIYPSTTTENYFCPVVYKSIRRTDEFHDGFKYLFQASQISGFNERQEAIKKILLAIGDDLDNSQWKELNDLYKSTKHIPLATLDIWKTASKCNKVLATLFFMMPIEFINQLSNEFLILWRSIEVKDWKASYDNFVNHYTTSSIPESILTQLIESKLIDLESNLGLGAVTNYLRRTPSPISVSLFEYLVNDQLNGSIGGQGLKGRHNNVDVHWPDTLEKEINAWYRRLPTDIFNLVPNVPKHQKSVVGLPIILAYASTNSEYELPELDELHVRLKLQQIKEFDMDWFTSTFDIAQGLFIAQKP